jgi:predicted outer membrane protein
MSWIQMSEAVRRLARTGHRTEPNVRAFLSNLFRNGLVRWRGSPLGVELHRGDLALVHLEHRRVSREFATTMRAVRAGMSAQAQELTTTPVSRPPPPPPLPLPLPPTQGKKPTGRNLNPQILRSFDNLCADNQITYARGGLRAAAKKLSQQFPDYSLKHIEKLISPMFRQHQSRQR